MRVFVTDGDQRATLAVTRSLGKRGIEVLVGEEHEKSLASSSRYCAEHITYPSPHKHLEDFCEFLLDFSRKASVDIVLPITDATTYLTSFHKKELEQYTRLPIPEFKTFDFVSNKWMLLRYAQDVGIPIPTTYFIDGLQSLSAILNQLEYPIVVKGGRSRIPLGEGWILTNVHYVASEEELLQLYRQKRYLRYPSLVQERIVGPGMGLFVLFNHGELVTTFSHRRLREKPPSGGISVLRESTPVCPDLMDQAVRLLRPLGWHGVAMLEYKLDERTAQPILMEVNGRFWGSLDLAIASGMDFPYLLYKMAIGDDIEVPEAYHVGVKSRWLLGDLDHLLTRLFRKDQELNLPKGFPSKIKTLLQFLKFYEPRLHYEILSLSDPRPFIYELRQYLAQLHSQNGTFNE